jgi:hypothetical protein
MVVGTQSPQMEKLQQDNAAAPSGHNVVERPPQFLRPVTTILTPGDHNPYAHISVCIS